MGSEWGGWGVDGVVSEWGGGGVEGVGRVGSGWRGTYYNLGSEHKICQPSSII